MMQLGGISNANDLIQVEIFYPFIGYTSKITSEKLSLFDLIGNIGGQMGKYLPSILILNLLFTSKINQFNR